MLHPESVPSACSSRRYGSASTIENRMEAHVVQDIHTMTHHTSSVTVLQPLQGARVPLPHAIFNSNITLAAKLKLHSNIIN